MYRVFDSIVTNWSDKYINVILPSIVFKMKYRLGIKWKIRILVILMNKSNFSVLMSVYSKDKPDFFEMALLSLKNQTLRPSEVIIVFEHNLNLYLEILLIPS